MVIFTVIDRPRVVVEFVVFDVKLVGEGASTRVWPAIARVPVHVKVLASAVLVFVVYFCVHVVPS